MTVESQGNKKSWTGDGSTTVYAYPYPFQKSADIEVYLDGTKQTTGYSVQVLSDYSSGANITFTTAPDDGVKIVIRRNIGITQEISYPENGEFPAKSHEKALDKLTLIILDKLSETIKVDPSTTETFSLYLPQIVAKKGLRINDEGTGFDLTDDDINDILSDPGFIAVSQDLLLGTSSSIKIAAGDKTNIDIVAGDKTNIDTVAGSISNVNLTGGSISNVNVTGTDLALGDESAIRKVNTNKTNIDTVAGSISNVNLTGGSISNVNTVAGSISNVNTNAANIQDINTNADNITAIQGASENATIAQTNAALSKQYAIGEPTEPTEGSAKYWAAQASQGQIQSDWNQTDNTKKDFIKNKDTVTNAIDAVVTEFQITLTTTWVGTSAPYTQTIPVTGILSTDNPIIGLVASNSFNTALLERTEFSKVYNAVVSAGNITFYASSKTNNTLQLQGKILR